MHDILSAIASLLPERYRPLVAALAALFAASQTVASQIVAQLPSSSADDPRYGKVVRALHWYGHARFRDEPGTIKPPIGGEIVVDPRDAEIERLKALVQSSIPVEVAPASERESIVAPAPSDVAEISQLSRDKTRDDALGSGA